MIGFPAMQDGWSSPEMFRRWVADLISEYGRKAGGGGHWAEVVGDRQQVLQKDDPVTDAGREEVIRRWLVRVAQAFGVEIVWYSYVVARWRDAHRGMSPTRDDDVRAAFEVILEAGQPVAAYQFVRGVA